MRVFYALSVPPAIDQYCTNIVDSLKKRHEFDNVRWTQPELLHITLRFHAKIDEEVLEKINTLLHQQLPHYQSVSLTTRQLLFLPRKKPHLLAWGILLNGELAGLVRLMNEATLAAGIPLEKRPFLGHVTLGRFNETTAHDIITLPNLKNIEAKGSQIVLYKSEPATTGSVYTPLDHFELK